MTGSRSVLSRTMRMQKWPGAICASLLLMLFPSMPRA